MGLIESAGPHAVAIAAASMLQAPASAQGFGAAGPAAAQGFGAAGPAVDLVLTNGKIITVDDRFSIAQAVAVRGDRIVAVGPIGDRAPRGPEHAADLTWRTFGCPGLHRRNHAHFMEEGVLWTVELRLDGVETRKQAIEMMRAKASSLPPGQSVYTLGGWSPDQFTDDETPVHPRRARQDRHRTTRCCCSSRAPKRTRTVARSR